MIDRCDSCLSAAGWEKRKSSGASREHGLKNMLSLPYQPLADLSIRCGGGCACGVAREEMVGIIIPAKSTAR